VEDVLPLPSQTSLEWGMYPKQKRKKGNTIPKKTNLIPSL
jgi:hypothetical protein